MAENLKNNIVGIVAEYNPFHSGHEYHIKKAKELAHAEFCVVVMSGDYIQRGGPAIFDKYTRTAMALASGADLVIEIPTSFATSSAEDFAACAVSLLDRLGVVDFLCFGSECGDISSISALASVMAKEPPAYVKRLKELLKEGFTFPEARNHALIDCGILTDHDSGILSSPNNILGIEYCKALIRQKSLIKPITITRKGNSYHSPDLSGGFASASAIRKKICTGIPDDLPADVFSQIPVSCIPLFKQGLPIIADDFSTLLNTALLRFNKNRIPFHMFADVSEDLSSRINRTLFPLLSFEDRIQALKTRQYTYTRISRALLHILLEITSDDISTYRSIGYTPYARVLGFKKASSCILSDIKKRGHIPLITKTADIELALEGTALAMLRQDIYCSHLYQAIAHDKYSISLKNEYTHSVVIF